MVNTARTYTQRVGGGMVAEVPLGSGGEAVNGQSHLRGVVPYRLVSSSREEEPNISPENMKLRKQAVCATRATCLCAILKTNKHLAYYSSSASSVPHNRY